VCEHSIVLLCQLDKIVADVANSLSLSQSISRSHCRSSSLA